MEKVLGFIANGKSVVLLQFCTLRRFKTFLCEFNRQFLRKSMFSQ